MNETGPKKRLTQAEKSAAMRSRLCEATLDALTEVGYDRVTTAMVAKKAGVSQGALTHQFSSKNDLMAAAFERLLTEWRNNRQAFLSSLTEGQKISADEFTEYLWRTVFVKPRYVAALELMLAARMNEPLGGKLRDILHRWRDDRDMLSAWIIGSDPENPETLEFLHLNICMLRGIAVHVGFDSDEQDREKLLLSWKNFLRKNSDRLPGLPFNTDALVSLPVTPDATYIRGNASD
ncbi:TetR/AcrR family transcriptional regulator [Thalassospira lucentensis]|uniref:TetR/AcrR family transcriptional regulator n=1 Tax=Thalassospira lucentensis TaxID=168935 RepID=UPI003AA8A3E8